jgi:hypothetical protein
VHDGDSTAAEPNARRSAGRVPDAEALVRLNLSQTPEWTGDYRNATSPRRRS